MLPKGRPCASGPSRDRIIRGAPLSGARDGRSSPLSVTTYTSLRNSVHVQVVFTEPIMNWTDIASRFFAMIYSALRSKLTLNLSDFSFNYGNALSDVRARYNLYGGATSVSLLPD